MASKRAIGIVRVSQPKGRAGETFHSPVDQRAAIECLCAEHGWTLIATHDELHVSGNALLENRPGLSQAVTAVLTGSADVIVGAHAERLWWSHEVRAQVLRLVQGAGGEVWSVDTGRLSSGTAADDFAGEVRTSADRLSRRQNAEKSRAAVVRAIARGALPYPNVPPGYVRGKRGILRPDPQTAPVIAEAFAMRARGETVVSIRQHLAANGIRRSFHGTQALLRSRLYLGEIHFGTHEPNLSAHEPIIDRETWQAVQRVIVPRGRRSKSDRLLARLGVLRCATCEGRMIVGNSNGYPIYRCSPVGDCPDRCAISGAIVEPMVVEAVRTALADVEGRASLVENARAAEARLEVAQAELDAAIRVLNAVGDEPAALERIIVLRDARNAAQAEVDHLGGESSVVLVNAAADWDRLSLDGRRALIRAVVARVLVAPGRGPGRVSVQLVGE